MKNLVNLLKKTSLNILNTWLFLAILSILLYILYKLNSDFIYEKVFYYFDKFLFLVRGFIYKIYTETNKHINSIEIESIFLLPINNQRIFSGVERYMLKLLLELVSSLIEINNIVLNYFVENTSCTKNIRFLLLGLIIFLFFYSYWVKLIKLKKIILLFLLGILIIFLVNLVTRYKTNFLDVVDFKNFEIDTAFINKNLYIDSNYFLTNNVDNGISKFSDIIVPWLVDFEDFGWGDSFELQSFINVIRESEKKLVINDISNEFSPNLESIKNRPGSFYNRTKKFRDRLDFFLNYISESASLRIDLMQNWDRVSILGSGSEIKNKLVNFFWEDRKISDTGSISGVVFKNNFENYDNSITEHYKKFGYGVSEDSLFIQQKNKIVGQVGLGERETDRSRTVYQLLKNQNSKTSKTNKEYQYLDKRSNYIFEKNLQNYRVIEYNQKIILNKFIKKSFNSFYSRLPSSVNVEKENNKKNIKIYDFKKFKIFSSHNVEKKYINYGSLDVELLNSLVYNSYSLFDDMELEVTTTRYNNLNSFLKYFIQKNNLLETKLENLIKNKKLLLGCYKYTNQDLKEKNLISYFFNKKHLNSEFKNISKKKIILNKKIENWNKFILIVENSESLSFLKNNTNLCIKTFLTINNFYKINNLNFNETDILYILNKTFSSRKKEINLESELLELVHVQSQKYDELKTEYSLKLDNKKKTSIIDSFLKNKKFIIENRYKDSSSANSDINLRITNRELVKNQKVKKSKDYSSGGIGKDKNDYRYKKLEYSNNLNKLWKYGELLNRLDYEYYFAGVITLIRLVMVSVFKYEKYNFKSEVLYKKTIRFKNLINNLNLINFYLYKIPSNRYRHIPFWIAIKIKINKLSYKLNSNIVNRFEILFCHTQKMPNFIKKKIILKNRINSIKISKILKVKEAYFYPKISLNVLKFYCGDIKNKQFMCIRDLVLEKKVKNNKIIKFKIYNIIFKLQNKYNQAIWFSEGGTGKWMKKKYYEPTHKLPKIKIRYGTEFREFLKKNKKKGDSISNKIIVYKVNNITFYSNKKYYNHVFISLYNYKFKKQSSFDIRLYLNLITSELNDMSGNLVSIFRNFSVVQPFLNFVSIFSFNGFNTNKKNRLIISRYDWYSIVFDDMSNKWKRIFIIEFLVTLNKIKLIIHNRLSILNQVINLNKWPSQIWKNYQLSIKNFNFKLNFQIKHNFGNKKYNFFLYRKLLELMTSFSKIEKKNKIQIHDIGICSVVPLKHIFCKITTIIEYSNIDIKLMNLWLKLKIIIYEYQIFSMFYKKLENILGIETIFNNWIAVKLLITIFNWNNTDVDTFSFFKIYNYLIKESKKFVPNNFFKLPISIKNFWIILLEDVEQCSIEIFHHSLFDLKYNNITMDLVYYIIEEFWDIYYFYIVSNLESFFEKIGNLVWLEISIISEFFYEIGTEFDFDVQHPPLLIIYEEVLDFIDSYIIGDEDSSDDFGFLGILYDLELGENPGNDLPFLNKMIEVPEHFEDFFMFDIDDLYNNITGLDGSGLGEIAPTFDISLPLKSMWLINVVYYEPKLGGFPMVDLKSLCMFFKIVLIDRRNYIMDLFYKKIQYLFIEINRDSNTLAKLYLFYLLEDISQSYDLICFKVGDFLDLFSFYILYIVSYFNIYTILYITMILFIYGKLISAVENKSVRLKIKKIKVLNFTLSEVRYFNYRILIYFVSNSGIFFKMSFYLLAVVSTIIFFTDSFKILNILRIFDNWQDNLDSLDGLYFLIERDPFIEKLIVDLELSDNFKYNSFIDTEWEKEHQYKEYASTLGGPNKEHSIVLKTIGIGKNFNFNFELENDEEEDFTVSQSVRDIPDQIHNNLEIENNYVFKESESKLERDFFREYEMSGSEVKGSLDWITRSLDELDEGDDDEDLEEFGEEDVIVDDDEEDLEEVMYDALIMNLFDPNWTWYNSQILSELKNKPLLFSDNKNNLFNAKISNKNIDRLSIKKNILKAVQDRNFGKIRYNPILDSWDSDSITDIGLDINETEGSSIGSISNNIDTWQDLLADPLTQYNYHSRTPYVNTEIEFGISDLEKDDYNYLSDSIIFENQFENLKNLRVYGFSETAPVSILDNGDDDDEDEEVDSEDIENQNGYIEKLEKNLQIKNTSDDLLEDYGDWTDEVFMDISTDTYIGRVLNKKKNILFKDGYLDYKNPIRKNFRLSGNSPNKNYLENVKTFMIDSEKESTLNEKVDNSQEFGLKYWPLSSNDPEFKTIGFMNDSGDDEDMDELLDIDSDWDSDDVIFSERDFINKIFSFNFLKKDDLKGPVEIRDFKKLNLKTRNLFYPESKNIKPRIRTLDLSDLWESRTSRTAELFKKKSINKKYYIDSTQEKINYMLLSRDSGSSLNSDSDAIKSYRKQTRYSNFRENNLFNKYLNNSLGINPNNRINNYTIYRTFEDISWIHNLLDYVKTEKGGNISRLLKKYSNTKNVNFDKKLPIDSFIEEIDENNIGNPLFKNNDAYTYDSLVNNNIDISLLKNNMEYIWRNDKLTEDDVYEDDEWDFSDIIEEYKTTEKQHLEYMTAINHKSLYSYFSKKTKFKKLEKKDMEILSKKLINSKNVSQFLLKKPWFFEIDSLSNWRGDQYWNIDGLYKDLSKNFEKPYYKLKRMKTKRHNLRNRKYENLKNPTPWKYSYETPEIKLKKMKIKYKRFFLKTKIEEKNKKLQDTPYFVNKFKKFNRSRVNLVNVEASDRSYLPIKTEALFDFITDVADLKKQYKVDKFEVGFKKKKKIGKLDIEPKKKKNVGKLDTEQKKKKYTKAPDQLNDYNSEDGMDFSKEYSYENPMSVYDSMSGLKSMDEYAFIEDFYNKYNLIFPVNEQKSEYMERVWNQKYLNKTSKINKYFNTIGNGVSFMTKGSANNLKNHLDIIKSPDSKLSLEKVSKEYINNNLVFNSKSLKKVYGHLKKNNMNTNLLYKFFLIKNRFNENSSLDKNYPKILSSNNNSSLFFEQYFHNALKNMPRLTNQNSNFETGPLENYFNLALNKSIGKSQVRGFMKNKKKQNSIRPLGLSSDISKVILDLGFLKTNNNFLDKNDLVKSKERLTDLSKVPTNSTKFPDLLYFSNSYRNKELDFSNNLGNYNTEVSRILEISDNKFNSVLKQNNFFKKSKFTNNVNLFLNSTRNLEIYNINGVSGYKKLPEIGSKPQYSSNYRTNMGILDIGKYDIMGELNQINLTSGIKKKNFSKIEDYLSLTMFQQNDLNKSGQVDTADLVFENKNANNYIYANNLSEFENSIDSGNIKNSLNSNIDYGSKKIYNESGIGSYSIGKNTLTKISLLQEIDKSEYLKNINILKLKNNNIPLKINAIYKQSRNNLENIKLKQFTNTLTNYKNNKYKLNSSLNQFIKLSNNSFDSETKVIKKLPVNKRSKYVTKVSAIRDLEQISVINWQNRLNNKASESSYPLDYIKHNISKHGSSNFIKNYYSVYGSGVAIPNVKIRMDGINKYNNFFDLQMEKLSVPIRKNKLTQSIDGRSIFKKESKNKKYSEYIYNGKIGEYLNIDNRTFSVKKIKNTYSNESKNINKNYNTYMESLANNSKIDNSKLEAIREANTLQKYNYVKNKFVSNRLIKYLSNPKVVVNGRKLNNLYVPKYNISESLYPNPLVFSLSMDSNLFYKINKLRVLGGGRIEDSIYSNDLRKILDQPNSDIINVKNSSLIREDYINSYKKIKLKKKILKIKNNRTTVDYKKGYTNRPVSILPVNYHHKNKINGFISEMGKNYEFKNFFFKKKNSRTNISKKYLYKSSVNPSVHISEKKNKYMKLKKKIPKAFSTYGLNKNNNITLTWEIDNFQNRMEQSSRWKPINNFDFDQNLENNDVEISRKTSYDWLRDYYYYLNSKFDKINEFTISKKINKTATTYNDSFLKNYFLDADIKKNLIEKDSRFRNNFILKNKLTLNTLTRAFNHNRDSLYKHSNNLDGGDRSLENYNNGFTFSLGTGNTEKYGYNISENKELSTLYKDSPVYEDYLDNVVETSGIVENFKKVNGFNYLKSSFLRTLEPKYLQNRNFKENNNKKSFRPVLNKLNNGNGLFYINLLKRVNTANLLGTNNVPSVGKKYYLHNLKNKSFMNYEVNIAQLSKKINKISDIQNKSIQNKLFDFFSDNTSTGGFNTAYKNNNFLNNYSYFHKLKKNENYKNNKISNFKNESINPDFILSRNLFLNNKKNNIYKEGLNISLKGRKLNSGKVRKQQNLKSRYNDILTEEGLFLNTVKNKLINSKSNDIFKKNKILQMDNANSNLITQLFLKKNKRNGYVKTFDRYKTNSQIKYNKYLFDFDRDSQSSDKSVYILDSNKFSWRDLKKNKNNFWLGSGDYVNRLNSDNLRYRSEEKIQNFFLKKNYRNILNQFGLNRISGSSYSKVRTNKMVLNSNSHQILPSQVVNSFISTLPKNKSNFLDSIQLKPEHFKMSRNFKNSPSTHKKIKWNGLKLDSYNTYIQTNPELVLDQYSIFNKPEEYSNIKKNNLFRFHNLNPFYKFKSTSSAINSLKNYGDDDYFYKNNMISRRSSDLAIRKFGPDIRTNSPNLGYGRFDYDYEFGLNGEEDTGVFFGLGEPTVLEQNIYDRDLDIASFYGSWVDPWSSKFSHFFWDDDDFDEESGTADIEDSDIGSNYYFFGKSKLLTKYIFSNLFEKEKINYRFKPSFGRYVQTENQKLLNLAVSGTELPNEEMWEKDNELSGDWESEISEILENDENNLNVGPLGFEEGESIYDNRLLNRGWFPEKEIWGWSGRDNSRITNDPITLEALSSYKFSLQHQRDDYFKIGNTEEYYKQSKFTNIDDLISGIGIKEDIPFSPLESENIWHMREHFSRDQDLNYMDDDDWDEYEPENVEPMSYNRLALADFMDSTSMWKKERYLASLDQVDIPGTSLALRGVEDNDGLVSDFQNVLYENLPPDPLMSIRKIVLPKTTEFMFGDDDTYESSIPQFSYYLLNYDDDDEDDEDYKSEEDSEEDDENFYMQETFLPKDKFNFAPTDSATQLFEAEWVVNSEGWLGNTGSGEAIINSENIPINYINPISDTVFQSNALNSFYIKNDYDEKYLENTSYFNLGEYSAGMKMRGLTNDSPYNSLLPGWNTMSDSPDDVEENSDDWFSDDQPLSSDLIEGLESLPDQGSVNKRDLWIKLLESGGLANNWKLGILGEVNRNYSEFNDFFLKNDINFFERSYDSNINPKIPFNLEFYNYNNAYSTNTQFLDFSNNDGRHFNKNSLVSDTTYGWFVVSDSNLNSNLEFFSTKLRKYIYIIINIIYMYYTPTINTIYKYLGIYSEIILNFSFIKSNTIITVVLYLTNCKIDNLLVVVIFRFIRYMVYIINRIYNFSIYLFNTNIFLGVSDHTLIKRNSVVILNNVVLLMNLIEHYWLLAYDNFILIFFFIFKFLILLSFIYLIILLF